MHSCPAVFRIALLISLFPSFFPSFLSLFPTLACIQTNFDFNHAQYLPCGYGKDCKYGAICTRAHSDPPQAEIAFWNFTQPLRAARRRTDSGSTDKRLAASNSSITASASNPALGMGSIGGSNSSIKSSSGGGRSTNTIECTICNVKMNSMAQLAQHQAGSKHRAQIPLLQSAVGAGTAGVVNGTNTIGGGPNGIIFDSRSSPDIRAHVSVDSVCWPVDTNSAQGIVAAPSLPARGINGMGSLPAQAWSELANGSSSSNGSSNHASSSSIQQQQQLTRSWSEDILSPQATMAVSKLLLPREGDPGPPPERLASMGNSFDDGDGTPADGLAIGGGGGGASLGGSSGGVMSVNPMTGSPAPPSVELDSTASSSFERARTFITLVKKGETDEVKKMIEEGVDVDCREAGCPALHWAIFMRRIETALLLIQTNAVRDLVDRDNQTALHICLHPRHGLSMLDDDGSADATKLASELLLAGWSADARDSHGRTALHHSAEQGNVAVTKLLLGAGASPDSHNNMGFSPSDVATLKARVATEGEHYAECRDLLRAASWQSPAPTASPMSVPLASGVTSGTEAEKDKESTELRNGEEIDLLFRPLMAALCSFNDQGKHEGGVELSQLASRLRPILDIVGLKCKAYATHAMNRGFITMRQSANRKQHYVSIAPAYRNGSFTSSANKRAAEKQQEKAQGLSASVSMPAMPIQSLAMRANLGPDSVPGSPMATPPSRPLAVGSDAELGGRRSQNSPYVPPGCYSPMGQQQRVERDLMGLLDSPTPGSLGSAVSAPHTFASREPPAETASGVSGVAGGLNPAPSFNERLFFSDPFSRGTNQGGGGGGGTSAAFANSVAQGSDALFGGMGAWAAGSGGSAEAPGVGAPVGAGAAVPTDGAGELDRLNAALMQWPASFSDWGDSSGGANRGVTDAGAQADNGTNAGGMPA